MQKRKSFSLIRWILQGGLLIAALLAVVVSIQSLRDPARNLQMDEIFEDVSSVWNWCPHRGEVLLESVMPGLIAPLAEEVCETETQPIQVSQIDSAQWKPLLKAKSVEMETEILLEGDLDKNLFRAQDLPFFSPKLSEHLRSLSSR